MNNFLVSNLNLFVYDTRLEHENDFLSVSLGKVHDRLSKLTKITGDKTYVYRPSNQLGFSTLNLIKILSENNDMMTKQSSQIFQKFSSLYKKPNESNPNKVTNGLSKNIQTGNSVNNSQNPSMESDFKEMIKFQVFDDIEQTFSEDLFSNGNLIGTVEGRIIVKNVPLIKQIVCGVHTENGFDLASHYLNYTISNKIPGSDSIVELKILQQETQAVLVKLMDNMSLRTFDPAAKQRNEDIISHFKEIKQTLNKSYKQKSLLYNYKDEEEIITSQEIMLNLGLKLVEILDNLLIDQKKIAMEILEVILKRAEFDLGILAYNIEENKPFFNRKYQVCIDYIKFMNALLQNVLSKFAKKINDKDIKNFIELVLTVSYFRIPSFRHEFLKAISQGITENYITSLTEIKFKQKGNMNNILRYFSHPTLGTDLKDFEQNQEENIARHKDLEDYLADQGKDESEIMNPLVSVIDWENLFYKKLFKIQKEKKVNELMNDIIKTLGQTTWKERIGRRGLGYMSIIKRLKNYMDVTIIANRAISWSDIPGFDLILNSLTYELANREVSQYPSLIPEVLSCFVNDSDIINCFFRTIVLKTNANDTNGVFMIFKILDRLFHEADQAISDLKSNFDYNLLKKCMNILIERDHSLCLGKVIWFLYENAHLMNEEHLNDMLLNLLENKFWNLFFHWSWQVRNIFYHFILYIVMFKLKSHRTNLSKNSLKYFSSEIQKMNLEKLRHSDGILSIEEFVEKKLNKLNQISNFIRERNLDPTFNNRMNVSQLGIKEIKKDCEDFIVVSMHHFKPIEESYNHWLNKIKNNRTGTIEYPDMTLIQPKDDVIEYHETW